MSIERRNYKPDNKEKSSKSIWHVLSIEIRHFYIVLASGEDTIQG